MSPDRTAPGGSPAVRARAGIFVAVVGPSGAGKDTLMVRAARHAALHRRVHFVRRIVTRDAVAALEDHDSLDRDAFARAMADGAFSLTWAAHGLLYALPRSVHADLDRGAVVVANLSRRVLGTADDAFGCLHVLEVTARPDILLERLSARGREGRAQIQERLDRQTTLLSPGIAGHVVIDNSSDAGTATDLFVRSLNQLCGSP